MYTKQHYSIQLLPETMKWLAWLHPRCPGPTPCQLCELYFLLCELYFLMTRILRESANFVFFQ
jgi:hypothetical protein